jgi:hypothetical protein
VLGPPIPWSIYSNLTLPHEAVLPIELSDLRWDREQINKQANQEDPARKDIENPHPHLLQVELVYTETAQEEPKKICNPYFLLAHIASSHLR